MFAEGQWLVDIVSLVIDNLDFGDPLSEAESLFHRFGQALAHALPEHQSIHYNLDGVLFVTSKVDIGAICEFDGFAIDSDSGKTLRRQIVKQGRVLAFPAPNDGSEDEKTRSVL
jgi:hypothetical protein